MDSDTTSQLLMALTVMSAGLTSYATSRYRRKVNALAADERKEFFVRFSLNKTPVPSTPPTAMTAVACADELALWLKRMESSIVTAQAVQTLEGDLNKMLARWRGVPEAKDEPQAEAELWKQLSRDDP